MGTLTMSPSCQVYGSIQGSNPYPSKLIGKTHVIFGTDWRSFSLSSKKSGFINRDLKVKAGWLFNRGGGKESEASCEQSESANEDILIFFFQLDLATRVQVWPCNFYSSFKFVLYCFFWYAAHELLLVCCYELQYALNMEQYDIAQQLRNKLTEVGCQFTDLWKCVVSQILSFLLEVVFWRNCVLSMFFFPISFLLHFSFLYIECVLFCEG